MHLNEELRTYGYTEPTWRFREILVEVHQAMHPAWTDEELMCNPRDAIRYCEAIRLRTCQGLPDRMILRALSNTRKRPDDEAD